MLKKYTSPLHLVLYVLSIISLLALSTPSFSRNMTQLFLAVGGSIFFDYLLTYLLDRSIVVVPLSSFITGLGIFFLLESIHDYFYAVVAFLAIASKFVLRINNKHIYNPSNFALLLVAFGCSDFATTNVFRWQVWGTRWSLFFFISGIFITRKVNRWALVITFFASFIFFAAVKSVLFDIRLVSLLLPLTGAPLHLFVFYMLTDPKTSPDSRKVQIMSAIAVTLLDSIFRHYENRLGLAVSLVTVRSLFVLYESYYKQSPKPSIA